MTFTADDIGKAIHFTDGPRTRRGHITRIGGNIAEITFYLVGCEHHDPLFAYLHGIADRHRILEMEGRTP